MTEKSFERHSSVCQKLETPDCIAAMTGEAAAEGSVSGERRYRTGARLAHDGPLHVVAAYDQLLHRNVAMVYCEGTRAERSAFSQQSRLFARINSKFTVDVYDSGTLSDRPYVIFERPKYLLSDAMEGKYGKFTTANLFELSLEIQEAVASLWAAEVEFGVIRAELVGVTEDGHVKLSPWPLRPSRANEAPVALAESSPSGDTQLGALVASAGRPGGDSGSLKRMVDRPRGPTDRAPSLAGPASDFPFGERSREQPTDPGLITAQVSVDPNVSRRSVGVSHRAKKRSARATFLVAAAILVIAVGMVGAALSSLLGQAGVAGVKDRGPAAAAVTSKRTTSTVGPTKATSEARISPVSAPNKADGAEPSAASPPAAVVASVGPAPTTSTTLASEGTTTTTTTTPPPALTTTTTTPTATAVEDPTTTTATVAAPPATP
jgi:hypothetical protein